MTIQSRADLAGLQAVGRLVGEPERTDGPCALTNGALTAHYEETIGVGSGRPVVLTSSSAKPR